MSKEGRIWRESKLIAVEFGKSENDGINQISIEDQMAKIKHRLRRKASFRKEQEKREKPEYPKKHPILEKPHQADFEEFEPDPIDLINIYTVHKSGNKYGHIILSNKKTNNIQRKFYHALRRDSKGKPVSTEQKIKKVLKYHNATPLLAILVKESCTIQDEPESMDGFKYNLSL